MAAIAAVAGAQTSPKTPTTGPSTSKSTPAAPTATSTKPITAASSAVAPWIKLPPGVPRVAHGPVKIPFALRYEDITDRRRPRGRGREALAHQVHRVARGRRRQIRLLGGPWTASHRPGRQAGTRPRWQAQNGRSAADGDPAGRGRVIPGFDHGLEGMRVGGKRRMFIPWQMAYGTHALPDRPDHPGIPAKSDLIFDVELVDVTDTPAPQRATMPVQHPGVPPQPHASPQPNAAPAAPAAPAPPAASDPAQPLDELPRLPLPRHLLNLRRPRANSACATRRACAVVNARAGNYAGPTATEVGFIRSGHAGRQPGVAQVRDRRCADFGF